MVTIDNNNNRNHFNDGDEDDRDSDFVVAEQQTDKTRKTDTDETENENRFVPHRRVLQQQQHQDSCTNNNNNNNKPENIVASSSSPLLAQQRSTHGLGRAAVLPPPWQHEFHFHGTYPHSVAALILTFLAIGVWQFQDPIRRWIPKWRRWMRWGENPNRNEDDGEGDDSCKNDSTTGTGTSAVGGFRWVFDVVLCGIVATWDYARAWYQMACEMGWSFSFTTNTNNRSGWWNTATNDNSMIYNGDDDDDFDQHRRTSNVGGKSRSNRRRPLPGREATIGAKANATSARRSRCNSLPELDDCCVAGVNQQHAMDPSFESESSEYGDEGLSIGTGQAVVQKGGILDNGIIKSGFTINHRHHIRDSNEWNWTRMVRTELEPAFRNEKDYPSGWLVYHPVLRVVPKAQADLYDREYSKHEHNSTEVLKHEFPSTETNREVVNLTNGSKDPLSVEADEKNDDSAPVSSHDSLMNGWEDVVAPDAASMQGKIGNTSYTDGVSKSNEKTATTPIGAIAGATSSTSHEGLPILQSAVTT